MLETEHAEAFYNRGKEWAAKGEFDLALADYDQALALNPKHADAYYHRGMVWGAKGDVDRAIADFDRAIELNPGPGLARYYRGHIGHFKEDLQRQIDRARWATGSVMNEATLQFVTDMLACIRKYYRDSIRVRANEEAKK
jgi:tetratricopeptide (TPR) repeat protein